jgi:hypothetical protein
VIGSGNFRKRFSTEHTQGSYRSGRVKFKDFSRTFKDMYQEIQGLKKALEISKK